MKRNNNKGFTLAELLIVVAIIAVLVAVAIPTFGSQLEKSRQAVDKANLRDAYAAAQMAILNQTDTTGTLMTANADNLAGTTANKTYSFGFDGNDLTIVDSETTISSSNLSTAAASTIIGKATTTVLVSSDQLPKKVTYTGKTSATDTTTTTGTLIDTVAGTTLKGIVVKIDYSATTNQFTLNDITFLHTLPKTIPD